MRWFAIPFCRERTFSDAKKFRIVYFALKNTIRKDCAEQKAAFFALAFLAFNCMPRALEKSRYKILKLFYRAQAGSKPQAALTKRAETCIIKE